MAATETATQVEQYLTFRLDDETFAIDVSQVREVLDYTSITKVPRTPDFMLGVINLRGNVVPVVDLRRKFGMRVSDITRDSCIIVLDVELETESIMVGALADSVQEVLDIADSQIEPPPSIGTKLDIEFIDGMGKKDDEFLMILNIQKIFSATELAQVAGTAGAGAGAA